MRILKIYDRYNGVCDFVGCYSSTPGTYPPPATSNPALIYNNNPEIYATHTTSGVKFYNSAVYKDIVNNTAYVVVIAENAGKVYQYINSAGFYNTSYPVNNVTGNPARTFYVESGDNFATFETDLPAFTDYNEFLDYVTNLQVQEQWNSIGAIEGKLGILKLPVIYETMDGTPKTDAQRSDFAYLPEEANLFNLYPSKVYGEEVPLVYAGNNAMAVRWNSDSNFVINYYDGESEAAVGFNKWDEEVDRGFYWSGSVGTTISQLPHASRSCSSFYIPVYAGVEYYFMGPSNISVYLWYTDSNNTIVSVGSSWMSLPNSFVIPTGATRLYFSFSSNIDYQGGICVNISKTEGYPKNGDYVPYTAAPLPIYTQEYTLAHSNDVVYVGLAWDVGGDPWHGWLRPCFVIQDAITGAYSYMIESVSDAYYETLYAWLDNSFVATVFGEVNGEAGGDGYAVPTDEPIPEPSLPTISSLNLNMTKMYKCTKEIINDFWTWLCDPDTQILNNLFRNDPLQGVIGINICPINIEADGNPEIKFLGLSTGVNAPRVTKQFQEIDCGTVTLDAFMHNTYLDFAPFTRIKCVIPYIGALELDPDDVMPSIDPVKGKLTKKKLQLKLRYDVLTGVCIAHIYVNGSLHYEAGGAINIPVPMTQKDHTEIANAVRGAISNVAQSIAQSSAVGAMTGGMGGAGVGIGGSLIASGIGIALAKPKYTYVHGGAGASAAYLGVDRPYILMEIPKLARPLHDEKFFGMPSYITGNIGSFTGFAKFKDPHIDTLTCTEGERDEILNLLSTGILNHVGTDAESSTPSTTPIVSGNTVITFLKNESERNVMGKTFNSTQKSIEGKLLFNNSITTPSFLISEDITGYNYAYIGLFGRFYYVTDVIVQSDGKCTVELKSDPLQSFKSDIVEIEAICERSENRNNFYINDGAMIVKQDSYIFTKQFSKDNVRFSFHAGDASYTLLLADA